MNKRILFLSNHFITLYSFRKELIKRLLEDGHEVFLSLPEDPDNKYFLELGCKIVITPIDRRGVNPAKDIKLLFFYKKTISEICPDVIFSYTIKPNIYGCLAHGKKYKQICNITGTGATFLKKNVISEICKVLYRLSFRNAYKVYFQNTGDRDFFVKNSMLKGNYEILPGSGCNLEEHHYIPMKDDGTTRFIFIGRVMKLKGIDEYLEAAKLIREKYDNAEFYIAGWNEEKEYKKIVAEYEQKGYVKYIGFRKNISDWIAKCDCTVLPSHGGEGIPNVLLESAAIGRICIGSRISGTKDVIEDGIIGFLFEARNVGSLVGAIEKVMKLSPEQKAEMGLAGREKVKKEYNREIIIQKYIKEVENEGV